MNVKVTFSEGLSDQIRATIANAIWGEDQMDQEGSQRLMHFFEYYRRETMAATVSTPKCKDLARIQTHAELITFISLLKENPQKARQELKSLFSSVAPQNTSSAMIDIDAALDLTVRLMFTAACRSQSQFNVITTGQVFRPRWKEEESLEQFIERVFPRCEEPDQGSRSVTIRAHKLTAYSLKRLLETSSRALAEYDVNTSTATALSLGCLRPDLISESLRTLCLLFPLFDQKSRSLLERDVRQQGLDPRLLGPFKIYHRYHETPRDALLPENAKGLYERYPYWGDRLYQLWKEAEDPTTISAVEKWSESKKSPRFTYWAAVIALSIAIFFGIVATILSALQVWISYCSWKDDPAVPGCWKKPS